MFDEQAMMRLVHNLARNAADALAGRPGRFRVGLTASDAELMFEFSDDGPGIPTELEGRLFELFASAKKGGTGLGLAICKKIAEEHHGSITCESTPGRGTTFRVILPRNQADGAITGEHPLLGK